MMKHRSREQWIEVIESAARSGLKVSDFCKQNNISCNVFYRYSQKLGYTSGGRRTEKWIAAAIAESESQSPSEHPALVPVPAQTVQMAWCPVGDDPYRQAPISILHDSFRIIVEDGFSQDIQTTLGIDITNCLAKNYTSEAIRYMQNQEVYLNQFLEDGNIASNNSKCERIFAFFAILRNQIKMFGSLEGARCAARLESIEQTAREYVKDTRIYYQFLFDEFIPFVKRHDPNTNFTSLPELADYLPWSEKAEKYREIILERERILVTVIENF